MDLTKFFADLETLVTAGETAISDAKAVYDAALAVLSDGKDYISGFFGTRAAVGVDPLKVCRAMVDAHKKSTFAATPVASWDWKSILSLILTILGKFA